MRIGELTGCVEIPPIQAKEDPFAGSYMGDAVFMTKTWARHLINTSARDMIQTPHIVHLGYIEPHNTRVLASITKPGDVFVDVGANVGYFSLLGAWRAWPNGQLWAFEPQPRLYSLLWDNLSINGYTGMAHTHRLALSDSAGLATLRIFEGYEAASTIRDVPADFIAETERQTGRRSRTIEVETRTLDQVMSGVPEVNVMKIDAEGHEPAILRGAKRLLERSPHVKILMELVPPTMGRDETLAHLSFLRSLGFSIFRIIEADASLEHQIDDSELVERQFSDLLLMRV